MKYAAVAALAAVLFAAVGCSTPVETAPETDAPAFDPERYLTASGVGASQAEARRDALAALAGIFESRVYAETASSAASFVTDDAPEAFEKSVDAKLRIESAVHLEGARIGSLRRDDRTGLFHALAVIDRVQAARQWYDQMAAADTRMQAELSALPGLTGRLIRLAALNRILAAAIEKAALRSRLRVIGRPTGGAEGFDLQPIADEAAALRSTAAFFVAVDGNRGRVVADRIERALGLQGIGVVRDRADAAGTVIGAVELTPLALGNRNVRFVRAFVRASVVDVDTGTQVAAIAEDVRKGHVDENEAVRMAIAAVSTRAAEKVFEALGLMGFSDAGDAM